MDSTQTPINRHGHRLSDDFQRLENDMAATEINITNDLVTKQTAYLHFLPCPRDSLITKWVSEPSHFVHDGSRGFVTTLDYVLTEASNNTFVAIGKLPL